MKRFWVVVLLVSLLGCAWAQTTISNAARQSARFALEPAGERGVSGSVLISDYGRDQTVMVLDVLGLRPNGRYSVRLRQGTCGDPQRLVRLLGTLSGRDSLETYIINTPYDQFRERNHYLEVVAPVTGVVACAEMGPAVTPLAERLPEDTVTTAPEATEPPPSEPEDVAGPAEAQEPATEVEAPAEAPATEEPVTEEPMPEEPVTEEPVTEEPADEETQDTQDEAEQDSEEDITEAVAEERVIEVRIANREDDAQEFLDESNAGHPPGFMHLHSRYIALTNNPEGWGTDQAVGLRFVDVDIPQGATIERAYLQFTVFEANNGPTTLTIRAQAADDAPAFSEGDEALFDISQRPATSAAQTWEPPAWEEVGAAGEAQRTPDLASVLQEVVNREGWEAGNALVFIITGESPAQGRMAVAHRENPNRAPLLVVEFSAPN